MAVQFDGGVVLGADSRTTMGSYIVSLGASVFVGQDNNPTEYRPIE